MLPPPRVPCRLMQDDDPAPLFPRELVSSDVESLGFRLEESIQRLEHRIHQLLDALEAQKPGHVTIGSAWTENLNRVAQQDMRNKGPCMDCETASRCVLDDNSEASAQHHSSEASAQQLHTTSQEESVDDVNSANHTAADPSSSKQSETGKNAKQRFRLGTASMRSTMRTTPTIEQLYHKSQKRDQRGGWLAEVIKSAYFDAAISVVVVVNALMLGVQIDDEVKSNSKHPLFRYFEWFCTSVFTLELLLRLWVIGLRRMLHGSERLMTVMDIVLVISSLLEALIDILMTSWSMASSAFLIRLLKVLRIGRLLRPLRTVALLGELRIIASMIASSFRPLLWLTCIICALTYCFALVLTQGTATYLSDVSETGSLPEEYAEVQKEYGSVLQTMYALFLAMTGGRDWGEIAGVIAYTGYVYAAVVVCFVFINLFSVLNIVTGIFVDGAIELAKRDRSMMIEKQSIHRESSRAHLIALVSQVDADGDGVISKDEFFSALQEEGVQEFMDALGIDPDNAAEAFLLLDSDGDGMIQLMEFVQGMEKIRGEAKGVDIQMLLLHTRKIIDMLNGIQGIQSSLVARIPVHPTAVPRKTRNRWDEPQVPHVPPSPKRVPGLPA